MPVSREAIPDAPFVLRNPLNLLSSIQWAKSKWLLLFAVLPHCVEISLWRSQPARFRTSYIAGAGWQSKCQLGVEAELASAKGMEPRFDIFARLPDGHPLWIQSFESLAE